MSLESLPYTLLLLLAQFSAGCAAIVLLVQVRSGFEAPFVRICAWMTVSGALLTTLLAIAIDPVAEIDSYRLDSDVMQPVAGVAMALMLFSLVHVILLKRPEETFLSLATGATTAGLGGLLLVLLASLVRIPAWSAGGPLLILFAGAFTLGLSSVAMVWGHWYLVKPSLDEKPLNEITLLTLGALLVELAIVAVNAAIPGRESIDSSALLAIDLPQNPAFWLRVGIGIVFPAILVFLAYVSSKERSMMSATGLLYIAVGAILAGEAVGRGLLFVTGAPV